MGGSQIARGEKQIAHLTRRVVQDVSVVYNKYGQSHQAQSVSTFARAPLRSSSAAPVETMTWALPSSCGVNVRFVGFRGQDSRTTSLTHLTTGTVINFHSLPGWKVFELLFWGPSLCHIHYLV